MPERTTAGDQLTRILQLIPLAARTPDASLAELAQQAGVGKEQIVRDLTEVFTRAYYHPAGSGEDLQVLIEAERVNVWSKGEFLRPPQLGPAEALALGLGLRMLAAEQPANRAGEILALARRLESHLTNTSVEELIPLFAADAGAAVPSGLRPLLMRAARERRRCEILYLKPNDRQPDRRKIEPYVLVFAEGLWYVLARCCRARTVRTFRLDRMLSVLPSEEVFEIPEDFAAADYLRNGRVYRAIEETEVTVRYSPRVARWIAERTPVDPQPDGSVLVRHPVADPRWLLRHVLQYGLDAEVLKPPEYRRLVADTLRRGIAEVAG
jgi:proteasome accessory factor C